MPLAAILTCDHCYASSVTGFADILLVANSHLRLSQAKRSELFDWHFVSLSGGLVITSNGLSLSTKKLVMTDQYDLVLIPSIFYSGHRLFDGFLDQQAQVCQWLSSQWHGGAWIAANCTGTFILAQTGLLNSRSATTTWWLERQFRNKFPLVDLRMQPVLTEMDRLICAGASASYLIQTVRVIERFAGPVIASQCAKTMLIDVSQANQIPYLPLLAKKNHSDELVHKVQSWLQSNMAQSVKISELADRFSISSRTLTRRFRSVLDQTPLAYLQDLRLESARALLDSSSHSIDEVACQVGYSDTSSFTRLFRQRVGLSPGAYRDRFQIRNMN